MATGKLQRSVEEPKAKTLEEGWRLEPNEVNCEVNTMMYRPHEGFANYTIATMTIKNGKVVDIQYSDPLNGTESLIRMDVKNGQLLEKLRRAYPAGYNCA